MAEAGNTEVTTSGSPLPAPPPPCDVSNGSSIQVDLGFDGPKWKPRYARPTPSPPPLRPLIRFLLHATPHPRRTGLLTEIVQHGFLHRFLQHNCNSHSPISLPIRTRTHPHAPSSPVKLPSLAPLTPPAPDPAPAPTRNY